MSEEKIIKDEKTRKINFKETNTKGRGKLKETERCKSGINRNFEDSEKCTRQPKRNVC